LPSSPSEPRWLSARAVITFNRIAVEKTGEPHRLLAPDLLDSALWRPRNHWLYSDDRSIAMLGATLLHGLSQVHPFEQGNKRAAFMSCVAFIELNEFRFEAPDSGVCADYVLGVVNHQIDENRSKQWLLTWMRRI
jgi:death on curing protein